MYRKTLKHLLISIVMTPLFIPLPNIALAVLDEGRPPGTVIVSGVVMDKTFQIGGYSFDLIGAGLLRYRTVFKGYVAALYLGKGHNSGDVFKDIPKSLVIEYFHGIAAQGFISATQQGFKNNLSKEQLEAIDQRARAFYSLYRDVQPGDRYSFNYITGKGSELALNGKVLGTVSGLDFANAFLSIWLGPNPLDKNLKKALLGVN